MATAQAPEADPRRLSQSISARRQMAWRRIRSNGPDAQPSRHECREALPSASGGPCRTRTQKQRIKRAQSAARCGGRCCSRLSTAADWNPRVARGPDSAAVTPTPRGGGSVSSPPPAASGLRPQASGAIDDHDPPSPAADDPSSRDADAPTARWSRGKSPPSAPAPSAVPPPRTERITDRIALPRPQPAPARPAPQRAPVRAPFPPTSRPTDPPRRGPGPGPGRPPRGAAENLDVTSVIAAPPKTKPGKPPKPEAASSARRVGGVDAARGLALLGMIAVHTLPLTDDNGTVTATGRIAAGTSAALFGVLVGVSVALLTVADRIPLRAESAPRHALRLLLRGLAVAMVGLALARPRSATSNHPHLLRRAVPAGHPTDLSVHPNSVRVRRSAVGAGAHHQLPPARAPGALRPHRSVVHCTLYRPGWTPHGAALTGAIPGLAVVGLPLRRRRRGSLFACEPPHGCLAHRRRSPDRRVRGRRLRGRSDLPRGAGVHPGQPRPAPRPAARRTHRGPRRCHPHIHVVVERRRHRPFIDSPRHGVHDRHLADGARSDAAARPRARPNSHGPARSGRARRRCAAGGGRINDLDVLQPASSSSVLHPRPSRGSCT